MLSELSTNDYAKILFIRFSLRDPRNTLCHLKEFLSKIRTSFELTFHPKFVSPYRDEEVICVLTVTIILTFTQRNIFLTLHLFITEQIN